MKQLLTFILMGFFSLVGAQNTSRHQSVIIQMGGFKNMHEALSGSFHGDHWVALGAKNCDLFFSLKDDTTSLDTQKVSVRLGILALHDLGFSAPATYNEIYIRARSLGLKLCTPEMGINFWKQYQSPDSTLGKYRIAMELRGSMDILFVAPGVHNKRTPEGKLIKFLYTEHLSNGQLFNPDDLFVFVF